MSIVGYPIRRYIYYSCPNCNESMKICLTDVKENRERVECPWCRDFFDIDITVPIGQKLSDVYDIEVEQVSFSQAGTHVKR